jgi:hypothetical protein
MRSKARGRETVKSEAEIAQEEEENGLTGHCLLRWALPPNLNLLLLKVSTVLLVDQHEVEKVADGEFLEHVTHGGGELKPSKEQPNRDGLALDRRTIHDLVSEG